MIAAIAVLPAIALIAAIPWLRRHDCAAASRLDADDLVLPVCKAEYEQTRSLHTGYLLADTYRRMGDMAGATALANALLLTDARADALGVLAKIARAQHRIDDAIALLQEARQLHRKHGDHRGVAHDDQALCKYQSDRHHYTDALQTVDECVAEASAAGDFNGRSFCQLTAARILAAVGYFDRANQEIDRAAPYLTKDFELAQVWFARANLQQELIRSPMRPGHPDEAIGTLWIALEYAERARMPLVLNIHLNLAYSLAEAGKPDEAERQLSEAAVLDRDRDYELQRTELAARIAYHRGNLGLAYSLNKQIYAGIEDEDERIEVSVMQAQIAFARGDWADAIEWAQLGVAAAERIRATETTSELRPWELATRREPYEVLFTAYARADKPEQAAMVFDQWQSRTRLDEMARPAPEPSPPLSSMATQLQSLGQWMSAAAKAPLMAIDDGATARAREALGKIDLLALVVAQDDVWRLTGSHGQLRLEKLGAARKLQELDLALQSAPTEHARANEIGALVLPEDVMRKTDEPLYIVLDAKFAAMPVAALRRDDQLLVGVRPVIRAPRLPVLGHCGSPSAAGRAAVLGDAAGDLPAARRESSRVASLLATTPLTGEAATSAALFAARAASLVHLAVHAEADVGGGVLRLYDRPVSAPEISLSKIKVPLVVLSGCETGRSKDPEVASSLAFAFLASGAHDVIATLRQINDAQGGEVTNAFYDEGGADDPVGALARVQARLAEGDNKEWPYFAVFSSEVCPRSP